MSARDGLAADITAAWDGFPETEWGSPRPLLRDAAAERLAAAGWSRPRMVATAAELDELPTGVVVRSAAGTIAARLERTRGVVFGDDRSFPWAKLLLPVTVLWSPRVEAGDQR